MALRVAPRTLGDRSANGPTIRAVRPREKRTRPSEPDRSSTPIRRRRVAQRQRTPRALRGHAPDLFRQTFFAEGLRTIRRHVFPGTAPLPIASRGPPPVRSIDAAAAAPPKSTIAELRPASAHGRFPTAGVLVQSPTDHVHSPLAAHSPQPALLALLIARALRRIGPSIVTGRGDAIRVARSLFRRPRRSQASSDTACSRLLARTTPG